MYPSVHNVKHQISYTYRSIVPRIQFLSSLKKQHYSAFIEHRVVSDSSLFPYFSEDSEQDLLSSDASLSYDTRPDHSGCRFVFIDACEYFHELFKCGSLSARDVIVKVKFLYRHLQFLSPSGVSVKVSIERSETCLLFRGCYRDVALHFFLESVIVVFPNFLHCHFIQFTLELFQVFIVINLHLLFEFPPFRLVSSLEPHSRSQSAPVELWFPYFYRESLVCLSQIFPVLSCLF